MVPLSAQARERQRCAPTGSWLDRPSAAARRGVRPRTRDDVPGEEFREPWRRVRLRTRDACCGGVRSSGKGSAGGAHRETECGPWPFSAGRASHREPLRPLTAIHIRTPSRFLRPLAVPEGLAGLRGILPGRESGLASFNRSGEGTSFPPTAHRPARRGRVGKG